MNILGKSGFIPPQNIEAEQALLGTILLKGIVPDNLSPDDFYKDSHRKIFLAMSALTNEDRHEKVDSLTLANYLKDKNELEEIGGYSYISILSSFVPSVSKIPLYVEIIKKKSVLRQIIAATSEAAQLSYEEQGDVPIILAKLQRQLDEIQASLGATTCAKLDISLDALLKKFHSKATHLESLNEAIGGLPNDVIVVGGAISMGKTSFSLGLLNKTAIQDRQRVAYFGSGVDEDEIFLRLISSMSGIEYKKLLRGSLKGAELKKASAAHKKIAKAPISIHTMPEKMSAMDITASARALVRQYKNEKIGAVIIENLQQLFWPETTKTRKEELDAVFGNLKALAVSLGIPVIISSQVDREITKREDKRPKPTDLVGTGDIEALARLIVLLYWDDYYHPQRKAKSSDGWVDAEIAIYKMGVPTILPQRFNPRCLQWKDAE